MTYLKYENGKEIPFTEEETIARDAQLKKFEEEQVEKAKVQYQEDRRNNFPSIGDQLDYIFHNGLAKWKTDIVQPVKDKFPKP